MANIKNLRMADTICADARVGIKKSLFGLTTKYIYLPTNSPIKGQNVELGDLSGKQLLRLIQAKDVTATIGDIRLVEADYGSYLLEVARSADGAFVALHLLHYDRLNYEPVADVRLFEGDEARAIGQIFQP